MEYTVSDFAVLKNLYPTWNELKQYLLSEDGGNLTVLDKNDGGCECIIRYDNGKSNMNLPHVKWFRSVVWDKVGNVPICVSPPKSENDDHWNTVVSNVKDSTHFQTFIEGTMINGYKTRYHVQDTWSIATKTVLGASGTFYCPKTFRDLWVEASVQTENDFYDCFHNKTKEDNVSSYINKPSMHQTISSPDFDEGETSTFASFILRHPQNRIAQQVSKPSIHIVCTGKVYKNGVVEFQENVDSWPELNKWISIPFIQPTELSDTSSFGNWMYSELYTRYGGHFWRGLVIKDNYGRRWKIETLENKSLRKLRGNESSTLSRFCRIKKEHNIHKYLNDFPEDSAAFKSYHNNLVEITNTLYNMYVDVFIVRKYALHSVSKFWYPYLYNIHSVYLNQLRPKGMKVNKSVIIEFINNFPEQAMKNMIQSYVRESLVV